jgi:hypothetical protein
LAWDEQKGDWAADAPVPPALRGVFTDQPHWVDLSDVRLDGGRPRGFKVARVAAPLRGKHLDELVGEHVRQHRRAVHLAGGAVAVMAVLTVLAVVVSIAAIGERNGAIRQQNIAMSRQFAAESLTTDPTDPVAARRLAVAAWGVFPTSQAESAMTTLLAEQQHDGMLPADTGPGGGVSGVAFSPVGQLLASAGSDGTVRLWNPDTGQPVGAPIPVDPDGNVNGMAFSPDGRLLATAGSGGTLQLWNPATGRPVGAPLPAATGPSAGVAGMAFSPGGQLLASADNNGTSGTVGLWQVSLFANPCAALCADVGAPARRDWDQYVGGGPIPKTCA